MWVLIVGAFAMGGWVTGIQFTVNNHTAEIDRLQVTREKDQDNSKVILETVIRSDERLKTLERRSR